MLNLRLLKSENVLLALALLIACLFFYSVNQILAPFLVAIFIAYLLDPVADFLEAKHLPRWLAVSLIFFVLSLFLITALVFVVPLLFKQLAAFIQQLPESLNWIYSQVDHLAIVYFDYTLPQFDVTPMKALLSDNWKEAGSVATQLAAQFGTSTMNIFSFVVNVLLVPVVTFYLLRDWDHLIGKMAALVPDKYKTTTHYLCTSCDEALSAFIRGQLMVMFALGCVYSIGLSLVGLQLALLLGMLAGLASIVPYLGVVVGIVSASLAAYFQFQTFNPVITVLAVFIIGQILESVVFTPIFVGDKIGLHPVVVIFAIMAGGELAGFTGILIALPMSAVLVVLVRYLLQQYKQSCFFDNLELGINENNIVIEPADLTTALTDTKADNN